MYVEHNTNMYIDNGVNMCVDHDHRVEETVDVHVE